MRRHWFGPSAWADVRVARVSPHARATARATAPRQPSEQLGETLIEFNNVHKAFGTKKILRGATFSVRRGEAVGIIGGSGTGKSTTLRLISGLLQPDSGEIRIKGRDRIGLISDDDESAFHLSIGLVFQNAALFDSLTVLENVGFQLYEHSALPTDRIRDLVRANLAKVGLVGVEDLFPSQLSGGMRKRVALARAITMEVDAGAEKLIMYDEPTAGLDPVASTVVEDLMRSLHAPAAAAAAAAAIADGGGGSGGGSTPAHDNGGVASYIVVTHQHSTIRRAVDRLVFLHDGRVVWDGPTAEFDSSDNAYVQQFAQGLLEGPIQYV